MKKTLILIFIFLSLVGIIGCGKKDTNKEWTPIVVDINKTAIKSNSPKEKLTYDEEKKELKIWKSVTIKQGKPNNLPKELPLIEGVKTYINSNVSNYFFYVIKWQTADKPGKWFVDELKKNGYSLVINKDLPEEEQWVNYSNMEFIKENTGKENTWIQNWKIQIFINNNTPDNIKKWLWLEWLFIEVYYE